MPSVNPGPSSSTSSNTGALGSTVFGVYTFATLPPANSVVARSTAYTSDFGPVYSNGTVWIVATPAATTKATLSLPKWRAALGRVRSGAGRARLALLGDSTTTGVGAGTGTSNFTGAFVKNRTAGLTTRLSALGVSVSNNMFYSNQSGLASTTVAQMALYDSRLTFGANWSTNAGVAVSSSVLGGQLFIYTAGAANNLSFTPAGVCDTAILWYAREVGNGSFTWNVDGGASLGTVATGGANAYLSTTATFTKGAHTINIVPNNDTSFVLIGIMAYDSTVPAVDIMQFGQSGALTSAFLVNTFPWNAFPSLATLAPDLTIIQLTINDSNNGIPVATYTANLQAIVNQALTTGDVIIESGIPSNTVNATNGTLANIVGAAQAVATASNVTFLDINARFVNWATANALGFMYTDGTHALASGYQDVAQFEAQALTTV